MKNFLRIAIVVVILVLLGFGTYVAFFKPANKDEVYLELSKLATYEDTIDEKLYDISEDNFSPALSKAGVATGFSEKAVEDYNKALNSDNNRKLLTKSENLIEMSVVREVEDGEDEVYTYTQYSYPQLKSYLDDVFNYYYAYSQAVNKAVPQKQLKLMKNSIEDYKKSLELINVDLKYIDDLQKHILTHPNEDLSGELNKRYKNAIVTFRSSIYSYVNLVSNTKDFVTKYVFGGEMITDKDSLLYELMMKSVINATAGDYNYNDYNLRKISDDKMSSATQFIKLAVAKDKNSQLVNTYRFESGTVVYNNIAYSKNVKNFKLVSIELRIGEDSLGAPVLYYGDTNYQFKSSALINIDKELGQVTFSVENNLTDALYALDTMQFVKRGEVYYKTINFWYDGLNDNRLYFNLSEDGVNEIGVINSNNQRFLTISTYNDMKVKVEGGDIVIPVEDATNISIKNTIKYAYENGQIAYYVVNGNYYKVNNDGKLANIENGDYILADAKVYLKTFYSKNSMGMDSPKSLNQRQMIKSYNKVVKNNPEQIDMLIELNSKQKNAFVSGDSEVRVMFLESYYDDLEYILACYGFIGEVTE